MKKIIVALLSVCFAISVHAQYAWKNLPIGGGGYVTGLVVHPQNANIMYARTDVGGAYKWDPASEKWIPITEMFTAAQRPYYSIDGIAIDPKNQSVVYICAGNGKGPSGILKSTDYGASWKLLKSVTFIGNGSKRWIGEPIQVDPNNSNVIYCGTRNSGLLQSSDGGATWTKITSVPPGINKVGIRSVAVDYTSSLTRGRSSVVYAAVHGSGIYQSVDGGITFSALTGSPANVTQMKVASNGALYVTAYEGVFKYAGNSWNNISPDAQPFNALDVAKDNPDKIVVVVDRSSTTSGPHRLPVYYSTTGGSSWSKDVAGKSAYNYQARWYENSNRFSSATSSIVFDPSNSNRVYLGDWYQVMRTDNITASMVKWTQLVQGLEEMVVLSLISPPHPNSGQAPLISGITDNCGFRHASLTNYPASRLMSCQASTGLDFCETNPDYMASTGFSKDGKSASSIISTDNGVTFSSMTAPGVAGKIAYSATNTKLLVAVPINSAPLRSTDRGRTWQNTTGAPSGYWDDLDDRFSGAVPLASDRVNGNTFYYLYKTGGFYRSTDGGANWDSLTNITVSRSSIVKAVYGREGDIWIAGGSKGGLYHSTNGGNSFSKVNTVSEASLIAFGKGTAKASYPAIYIYGTVNDIPGVYQSVDGGTSWTRINSNTSEMGDGPSTMEADREIFGRVYIGTRGRGIYYSDVQ